MSVFLLLPGTRFGLAVTLENFATLFVFGLNGRAKSQY